VRVGNVIKVRKDEYFPCDVVLLWSSNEDHTALIETKQLDGESNLKRKFVSNEISKIIKNE